MIVALAYFLTNLCLLTYEWANGDMAASVSRLKARLNCDPRISEGAARWIAIGTIVATYGVLTVIGAPCALVYHVRKAM